MALKSLVDLFNPPSVISEPDAEDRTSHCLGSESSVDEPVTGHVQKSLRRIPLAYSIRSQYRDNMIPLTPFTTLTTTSQEIEEMTSDVTDNVKELYHSAIANHTKLLERSGDRESPTDVVESFLKRGSPEYSPRGVDLDFLSDTTLLPSSTPVESYPARRHTPTPATVVFARNAPPLYLPKLDRYLSSIPPPDFHCCKDRTTMFPPMDKLDKLGKSLDDLEANAVKTPAWRNRNSILGSIASIVLGITGSSALASFYSLQGLFNTIQIFALILSTIVPVGGRNLTDRWRKLFLGTIPNLLALNFASTQVQSLLTLLIFMTIAAGLLYSFHRSSRRRNRYDAIEGLQQTSPKGEQWSLVIVTFLITIIYLPLSTMAVHVLVWSQDLWVVPNPYTGATSHHPILLPIGPASEYRDPLDFCWTTTMKRNEVNYAPVVIVLSAMVFLALAICYPILLHHNIKQSVPMVDKFTELGRARNSMEMDEEYHRLLSRDRNPFVFLYSGFRRGWGTYESTWLAAKLSTLAIVAVIDPDNCLFHSLPRSRVSVVRQILLLIVTVGFFLAQCIYAPFLDPVNNASEWISRLSYVSTSVLALAVALNAPGQRVLDTYVLYSVYAITYGFSFYFTVINLGFIQRAVKRLTKRIDFSIDIFSPKLDLSPSSPHTKRRIWQESITTLILTSPECGIPEEQPMVYAQARDSEFPPYLLGFSGTPGERHVENLKILREVGTLMYNKAVAVVSGPDRAWYQRMEDEIQKNFIGPDCYWKNLVDPQVLGCTNYFGNAWWIPFPPTLVIRYDDGPLAILRELSDLEAYIAQNSNPVIQRRRQVRTILRALENQVVVWPYNHVTSIGAPSNGWFRNKHYRAMKSIHYRCCLLRIKRQGKLVWGSLQLGSGFKVELLYEKKTILAGDAIGLEDDFDLTAPLAKFFSLNEALIPGRLKGVEDALLNYRRHCRKVGRWKSRALTYGFLSKVYDHPLGLHSYMKYESDLRVRQLMLNSEATFDVMYERLANVARSETTTWWYIFWDDLWRRNRDTISGLQRHATDFNPYYPTSIAYTPLPRAVLENFLVQRGLLSRTGRSAFFTSGFLNKLYVRLNDTVFRLSGRAIMFHIGRNETEREMIEVDLETRIGQKSTIGTGGGTDHDNTWIQVRPNYRWEGILNDTLGKGKSGRRHLLAKLGTWLGLTPTWRSGIPSSGLALDVRLENGHYVMIEDC